MQGQTFEELYIRSSLTSEHDILAPQIFQQDMFSFACASAILPPLLVMIRALVNDVCVKSAVNANLNLNM